MNFLLLFLKGLVIGLFMLVPGISGGSIAIILNLYDELLINLNDIFKTFRKSFVFLFVVLVGGILGIFISSFLLDIVIKDYYFEMIYIFTGVMLYYLISLITKPSGYNIFKKLFLILFGVILGSLLMVIPNDLLIFKNEYLQLFLLGIFLAIALILPGVSVSYVLLLFRLYDDLLLAIQTFDYLFLLKMGIFLLIGIILVIKFLYYLIINKKETMELIIVGFVVSSLWIVLPPVLNNKMFIYAVIFILLGMTVNKLIKS